MANSNSNVAIHWFRQDLRLADNPGLYEANAAGKVLPIYILDDDSAGKWKMGAASRVWLHDSLAKLDSSLGGHLKLFNGNAAEILPRIIADTGASAVHWNRCYEPWRIARDEKIKKALQEMGVDVQSHNGSLLWEPWT
ncbi:MAG: deoxyribodipyrimidine photo-lyase, partial [Pseudomonadales bacterium]|nr:deoxyribodipyrimidine photo-lyase [Pseudomonadales bacterium]